MQDPEIQGILSDPIMRQVSFETDNESEFNVCPFEFCR